MWACRFAYSVDDVPDGALDTFFRGMRNGIIGRGGVVATKDQFMSVLRSLRLAAVEPLISSITDGIRARGLELVEAFFVAVPYYSQRLNRTVTYTGFVFVTRGAGVVQFHFFVLQKPRIVSCTALSQFVEDLLAYSERWVFMPLRANRQPAEFPRQQFRAPDRTYAEMGEEYSYAPAQLKTAGLVGSVLGILLVLYVSFRQRAER